MTDLFRKEVLEARRSQWLGALNLATPLAFTWWALLAAALAVAIVGFLVLGHYTRRATVAGQLQPRAGLVTLSARTTGTVTRTLVEAGERAERGRALVEVSANLVSTSMGDTHTAVSTQLRVQATHVRTSLGNLAPQAAEQARDLRARIGLLESELRQIDGQRVLQRKQADTATAFLEKIRPVADQGYVSGAQFNQFQSVALTAQAQLKTFERQRLDASGQLSSLRAQLAQLPLDTETRANQLRGQLAQLDAQLAGSEAERSTVLRAPRAGIISNLLVKRSQNVTAGQSVLSILPEGSNLEAQLLVPSSAIGFVEPGHRVVLRYRAYPYQKFGQQYGNVTEVSRSALGPAETASLLGPGVDAPGPLYRVLVALDRQAVTAYGKLEALKPGMALDADILLDRRSLWQWVFEPLYGLRQQIAATGGRAP